MVLPNQLTVLRIILTPFFVWFFLSDSVTHKQIAIAIFVVAALTDWYDGWLARKFNYITEWGKFMDPLADKILTSAAFFAFAYKGVFEYWMVSIIVVRDFLITFLRWYAGKNSKPLKTSNSAKVKTFMQMFFLYYCLLIFTLTTIDSVYYQYESVFNTIFNPNLIHKCMLILTLFTLYTGVEYIIKNRKIFFGK